MPVLLIPFAVVGYKMWEDHKKKKAAQEGAASGDDETKADEPTLVVDTLPHDSPHDPAGKLQLQASDVSKEEDSDDTVASTRANLDSIMSGDDEDDDDDMTGSTFDGQEDNGGPLFGIRKFFGDKIVEHRSRELQKAQNRQLALQIARGQQVPMPKISYK
jgi:hypothetical protein